MQHTLSTSPYSNYTFIDNYPNPQTNTYPSSHKTHQPFPHSNNKYPPTPMYANQYQQQIQAMQIINDRAVQALYERELKKTKHKTSPNRKNPLLRLEISNETTPSTNTEYNTYHITHKHPPNTTKYNILHQKNKYFNHLIHKNTFLSQLKKKKYEIRGMGEAPANCEIQSIVAPNGAIYHPCHGFSNRKLTIFDLFPQIVRFSSKKFNETARAQFLINFSDENNTILTYNLMKHTSNRSQTLKKYNINENDMWFGAFQYLFNDMIRFEFMSNELTLILKQFMSTHYKRLALLLSIKKNGFIAVVNNISVKLADNRACELRIMENKNRSSTVMIDEYRMDIGNGSENNENICILTPSPPPPSILSQTNENFGNVKSSPIADEYRYDCNFLDSVIANKKINCDGNRTTEKMLVGLNVEHEHEPNISVKDLDDILGEVFEDVHDIREIEENEEMKDAFIVRFAGMSIGSSSNSNSSPESYNYRKVVVGDGRYAKCSPVGGGQLYMHMHLPYVKRGGIESVFGVSNVSENIHLY